MSLVPGGLRLTRVVSAGNFELNFAANTYRLTAQALLKLI